VLENLISEASESEQFRPVHARVIAEALFVVVLRLTDPEFVRSAGGQFIDRATRVLRCTDRRSAAPLKAPRLPSREPDHPCTTRALGLEGELHHRERRALWIDEAGEAADWAVHCRHCDLAA